MDSLITADKEQAIKTDISLLQEAATNIVVNDDASAKMASEFLAKVKGRSKRLKELRTELTKPYKDIVKDTDNWFKTQEFPLIEIEVDVKGAIARYLDEKERIAREEAEKAEKARKKDEAEAKKEEEKIRKAKGDEAAKSWAEMNPPDNNPLPAEKPRTSIQTEEGQITSSKIWKWEVVDETKVPREFLKVNDAEITKAVRGGAREIKGVRIYQERSVAVR